MNKFKDVVLCVYSLKNDARVYSHTTLKNKNKRIQMLKYNIKSINGKGTAVFARFAPFDNHTETDYIIEEYIRTQ